MIRCPFCQEDFKGIVTTDDTLYILTHMSSHHQAVIRHVGRPATGLSSPGTNRANSSFETHDSWECVCGFYVELPRMMLDHMDVQDDLLDHYAEAILLHGSLKDKWSP